MSCEGRFHAFCAAIGTSLGGIGKCPAQALRDIQEIARNQAPPLPTPLPPNATLPERMQGLSAQARETEAEAKTVALFRLMQEQYGIAPPAHGKRMRDGVQLPLRAACYGYAAVWDTIQAGIGRHIALPQVAAQVAAQQERQGDAADGLTPQQSVVRRLLAWDQTALSLMADGDDNLWDGQARDAINTAATVLAQQERPTAAEGKDLWYAAHAITQRPLPMTDSETLSRFANAVFAVEARRRQEQHQRARARGEQQRQDTRTARDTARVRARKVGQLGPPFVWHEEYTTDLERLRDPIAQSSRDSFTDAGGVLSTQRYQVLEAPLMTYLTARADEDDANAAVLHAVSPLVAAQPEAAYAVAAFMRDYPGPALGTLVEIMREVPRPATPVPLSPVLVGDLAATRYRLGHAKRRAADADTALWELVQDEAQADPAQALVLAQYINAPCCTRDRLLTMLRKRRTTKRSTRRSTRRRSSFSARSAHA